MINGKPSEIFRVIENMLDSEDNVLTVSQLCKLAGVSRSGYYKYKKTKPVRIAREMADSEDFKLIKEAFNFKGYDKGAKGIHMRLLRMGKRMNVKKIRRLMKKYNLICPIREANPYRRMAKAMRTDNVFDNSLNREFKALGPRMALMTDITYISKEDGFCYLSTIIDGYTKQILSYVLSDSLELDFVLETIEILMKTHGEELTKDTIIHSDQGSHYTSYKFIDVLKDNELIQSMSRRGNCWDNAPQESFFGHMKSELRLSKKMTYDEIKDAIEAWIDYYNNDRYQWQLGKLSPNEYYEYITTGYSPLLEIDI